MIKYKIALCFYCINIFYIFSKDIYILTSPLGWNNSSEICLHKNIIESYLKQHIVAGENSLIISYDEMSLLSNNIILLDNSLKFLFLTQNNIENIDNQITIDTMPFSKVIFIVKNSGDPTEIYLKNSKQLGFSSKNVSTFYSPISGYLDVDTVLGSSVLAFIVSDTLIVDIHNLNESGVKSGNYNAGDYIGIVEKQRTYFSFTDSISNEIIKNYLIVIVEMNE